MEQPSTVRILEIAKFYVGEANYLGVDDTSFATIVDEILTATEGLGDLSFCLEAPVECAAIHETSRAPHDVGPPVSSHVYEEMIYHRFPKANPITISQHAEANYYRFVTLQDIRRQADSAESDKEKSPLAPLLPVDLKTRAVPPTIFHDSGVGTSHRHESSYAQSLMSFTRRSHEQYAKLLPKLPDVGASESRFDCFICLRNVQFENKDLWK
jgi:hypothetical protein